MSERSKVFAMVAMQRSWEYSSYAIKTFAKYTPFADQDLFILLDDGSFGEPPDWVLPRVKMVNSDAVASLAANINMAMTYANERQADLYFLHNDLIFPQGWIDSLLPDQHSIVISSTNQDFVYQAGGVEWGQRLILTDYSKRAPFLREIVKIHRSQQSGYLPVLAAPFPCVKIPHEIYSVVGEFDLRFGKVGGEDLDYCLRAIEAGFGVARSLDSFVLHFGAKSTIEGGEKVADTNSRIAQIRAAFEKKWGCQLTKLIIDKDCSVIDAAAELKEMTNSNNFRFVIEQLKGKN